jgi:hypothetical protein
MSFIAGYYSIGCTDGAGLTVSLEDKLRAFSIKPSDEPVEYDHRLLYAGCCHLMLKKKTRSTARARLEFRPSGELIALLGFNKYLDMDRAHVPVEDLISGIKNADGEYICMLVDREGVLHIINDRFAARPFYVMQADKAILFSSNLWFLIRLKGTLPSPDPMGWMQLCAYCHTIDTRTVFQGIRRLRPATHIRVSGNCIDERRYWRLAHDVDAGLDPGEFADRVFDALQESAKSRLGQRSGIVALSGGLDSRLVAAMVPKNRFSAFTFLNSLSGIETKEVRAATAVADRLGLKHKVSRFSSCPISETAKEINSLVGGLVPLHHPAKTMLMIDEMTRTSGFLVGGVPGDVLAGAYIPAMEYLSGNNDGVLLNRYIADKRNVCADGLKLVFRDDIVREFFPKLDQVLADSFATLVGPTLAHKITAWAQVFRQPAFTFTSPIHNHPDVTESFILLGYEYVDLMLKLPASWLFKKNFYKFMIHRCLPVLRDVIDANTGQLLQPQMLDYTFSPAFMSRRSIPFLRIARNSIPQPVKRIAWRLRRHEAPSFEASMLREDYELHKKMKDTLVSSRPLQEMFDVPKCLRLLDSIRPDRPLPWGYNTEVIGSLAAACFAYRVSA